MSEWRKARHKPFVIEFREVIGEREIIETREGKLTATRHDFIIRDYAREIYPIDKGTFKKIYNVFGEGQNEPEPEINRNVVCAGCGKLILIGQPFSWYRSMMDNSLMYMHKDEECWELYSKWRKKQLGWGAKK